MFMHDPVQLAVAHHYVFVEDVFKARDNCLFDAERVHLAEQRIGCRVIEAAERPLAYVCICVNHKTGLNKSVEYWSQKRSVIPAKAGIHPSLPPP